MKLFGTDGIRGKFNETPITHDDLVKIGYAFAKVIFGEDKGKIFISNDGRESASIIESALSIGITLQGSEVCQIGLYTTPGLSIYLNTITRTSELYAGIQITASHNPYYDNGVKFFDKNGFKINSKMEALIEDIYNKFNIEINNKNKNISHEDNLDSYNQHYISYINDYFNSKMSEVKIPERKFNILIDCANGAASKIINRLFKDSFINLIPINDKPSGQNINHDCGATNTNMLEKFIIDFNNINANSFDYDKTRKPKELKIDLGAALDGDGDRIIFISPFGKKINGDDVLFILALFHKKFNEKVDSVVGTQMTNYGIQDLYKKHNIKFTETHVGDKYVLKEMIKSNSSFGGESSGHILIQVLNGLYIGDGIITLINLLEVLFKQDKNIDQLKKEIISIPSKLLNIKVNNKKKFLEDEINIKLFSDLERMLGPDGRILLRPSGTENLIRLLLEHKDSEKIEILSQHFYDNINKHTLT